MSGERARSVATSPHGQNQKSMAMVTGDQRPATHRGKMTAIIGLSKLMSFPHIHFITYYSKCLLISLKTLTRYLSSIVPSAFSKDLIFNTSI